MTPDAAILRTTLIIYGTIFVLTTLLTLAFRRTDWGRNIVAAIGMWLVIFALFLATAYAGWVPFAVLIVAIAYGAIREFYTINRLYDPVSMAIAALALLLMTAAIRWDRIDIFHNVPLIAACMLLPLRMCRNGTADFNRAAAVQLLGIVYWGWLTLHFLLIHRLECGFGAIVMLTSLIALNDNCAYYVGKLLGKNSPKLFPSVSPGKTWTGFAGGLAGVLLGALLFRYTLPHLQTWQLLTLGAIVSVMGMTGDLVESAMKRDAGVKDSGHLIPGHGGVMDRFDAWTFTSALFYYTLVAFEWT